MFLDKFIPRSAIDGTRADKLKSALFFSSLAALNGTVTTLTAYSDNRVFIPATVVNGLAMLTSTFPATYSLMSAMEPDTPQKS